MAAEAAGRLLVARENWQNRLQYLLPDEDASRLLSVTAGDARFAWDTVDSPQFAIDRYGIPWLFFIDGARQAVFYTRWLGRGWGAFGAAGKITRNTARMEDSHLPVDRVAVEERQLPGRSDIALLVENDSTTPSAVFRRIAVPTLAAEPGRKILFFDLEEIASLDGLSLALNQPRKEGQVLGPGAPGEPDADRIGPPVRVLKQNGLYRMWYAGVVESGFIRPLVGMVSRRICGKPGWPRLPPGQARPGSVSRQKRHQSPSRVGPVPCRNRDLLRSPGSDVGAPL